MGKKRKKTNPWDFYNITDKQREHALHILHDTDVFSKALVDKDPMICYAFNPKLIRKLDLWVSSGKNILITRLKDPD